MTAMSLITELPRPPRLSGLGSVKLRRAAIARYVEGQPPAVPRAWLDVLLKRARSGDADARSSLLAWASARGHEAVVCSVGPGIVGTNTRLGFSGMAVGSVLDAAVALVRSYLK